MYMVLSHFPWCPWLNCAYSCMVWKISSLWASWQTKLSLTIKTDNITRGRGMWIRTGSYQGLWGEWVNMHMLIFFLLVIKKFQSSPSKDSSSSTSPKETPLRGSQLASPTSSKTPASKSSSSHGDMQNVPSSASTSSSTGSANFHSPTHTHVPSTTHHSVPVQKNSGPSSSATSSISFPVEVKKPAKGSSGRG